MKKATIKWFKRLTLVILVIGIIAYLWVDYEIDHLWGAHTKVVDHTKLNVAQENIAITNVTILSVDGKRMIGGQTVLIEKGIITSIGSDRIDTNASISIDGSGKYLIPGLIDSHIHLWQSPNDLLLYAANGITHIRELNGSKQHLQWREEINNGRLGPKMFVASSRVNSNGLIKSWFEKWTAKITSINSFNSAHALVQSFVNDGYDAIKTYTFINNKDYWALNKATTQAGIPLIGHTPVAMTLDEVFRSNQKEFAHIEELIKALDREFGGYNDKNAQQFLQFIRNRSEDISNKLVTNKIAVVSTLWLSESFAQQKRDLNAQLQQVQFPYVNPGIAELSPITSRAMGWLPGANLYRLPENISPEKKNRYLVYWQTYAKAHQIMLKSMSEKGVIILAGTDANVPVAVPGFSLHDELISLNQAGMSNSQALLAATKNPAAWMKQRSGVIQESYRADLILLNKNPLDNIENTKAIDTVILNGKLLNREKLDAMLAAVKQANDESRSVEIDKYKINIK
jgi:hypothetical protein